MIFKPYNQDERTKQAFKRLGDYNSINEFVGMTIGGGQFVVHLVDFADIQKNDDIAVLTGKKLSIEKYQGQEKTNVVGKIIAVIGKTIDKPFNH